MFRLFTLIILLWCVRAPFLSAQEERLNEGGILSIDGKIAVVQFEKISPGVGDEVVFVRRTEIVDPVSLKVRGGTEREVAFGIVEDVGLGKTYVNIISLASGVKSLEQTDAARVTGREKRIIRRKRVVGKIQELVDEDEIAIDVGSGDEINEGDMFLIQRTEIVYDIETNEVTGEKQIEVGRGTVSMVTDTTSMGDILLNPGVELNIETDDIVFEPTVTKEPIGQLMDSGEVEELMSRVSFLEEEVFSLRATVDSLSQKQREYQDEFRLFQSDVENVVTMLQSPAGDSAILRRRNDEPVKVGAKFPESYRQALDICLKGEFDSAIKAFVAILETYPDADFSDNCRYWIGQSHYSKGDYTSAAEWFRSVKSHTKFRHKDDDASIMLGITYYLSGDNTAALEEFRDFVTQYPKSEYRGKVERWIDRLS